MEKQKHESTFLKGVKRGVTNLVYFRLVFKFYEMVCPQTELTFLVKSGIRLAFHFSTLTNLLLIFINAHIARMILEIFCENDTIPVWVRSTFRSRFSFQLINILPQTQLRLWFRGYVWSPLTNWLINRVPGFQNSFPFRRKIEEEKDEQRHRQDENRNQEQEQVEEDNGGYEQAHQQREQQQELGENKGCDQALQHIEQQENSEDVQIQEENRNRNCKGVQKKVGRIGNKRKDRSNDTQDSEQEQYLETVEHQPVSAADYLEIVEVDIADSTLEVPDDEENKLQPITLIVRLKLTFIVLLKSIYTPIAEISFQLVHCIAINSTSHLYVYGDLKCYTWWQYVILIVVIPGLVLFPLSFGMVLDLIKTQQIKTTQFLLGAGIPYYGVFLYLKRLFGGMASFAYSSEDIQIVSTLLKDYDEVYRQHNQLISWPVVQLYRHLLIAAVKTFVIDPMYRSLAFLPIFCIFFVHDRSAKPFQNKSVNVLQTSSTVCLIMIIICNMIFSFSLYMTNIQSIPNMETVMIVLSYIESIVYFIFPLMLPISILWRKYVMKAKYRLEYRAIEWIFGE